MNYYNNCLMRKTIWFNLYTMGPLSVLVSLCFRENVIVTCKILSFLCSLGNFLLKNGIAFFFGNQISKWRSFEIRAVFDLLFTFFSHQGKYTKIPSAHISLTFIHVFCSPYWPFLPFQFCTNWEFIRYGFSLVYSLSGSWCWSLFPPVWSNQLITKWWAKLDWNVYYWYLLPLMENL